ncbi:MAG TPA: hypothetical protein V6C52_04585 [Coleofasciculaceae cyanobacterium]|jgi:hypothetical protein
MFQHLLHAEQVLFQPLGLGLFGSQKALGQLGLFWFGKIEDLYNCNVQDYIIIIQSLMRTFDMKSKYAFILGIFLLISSGCQQLKHSDSFEKDTKEIALARAKVELQKYATEYGLSTSEFKGPYFDTVKALDYPAYIVCYKHPLHYFCYDDWKRYVDAAPKSKITPEPGGMYEWLERQK